MSLISKVGKNYPFGLKKGIFYNFAQHNFF
jgi:hypothetical protein